MRFARHRGGCPTGRRCPASNRSGTPICRGRVDWGPLLDGIEQVIHLAGIAHTGECRCGRLRPRQSAGDGGACGRRCRGGRPAFRVRVVDPGANRSAADHALTERDVAAPTDDYGRSKLAAEAAVRAAGVPFTILRPVLLYGPGVKGNFALLLRAPHVLAAAD